MKATLKRADLLSAITAVKPCIGKVLAHDEMNGQQFYALISGDRGLLVCATNGATLLIQVKAKVTGRGTMLLPAAAVTFLQSVDSKDVTLQAIHKVETRDVDDSHYEKPDGTRCESWTREANFVQAKKPKDFHTYGVKIDAGESRNSYGTPDPMMVQPLLPAKAYTGLPAIAFKALDHALEEVAYAASGGSDSRNTILQCVCLAKSAKGLDLVATDGERLAITTLKMQASIPQTFAMDPHTVSILRTWKERTTLRFRKETHPDKKIGYMLIFQSGALTLIAPAFDGTFPAYQKVLPAALQKGITVRKSDLQRAVKVARTVVGKDGTIRLVSKGRNLQVVGLTGKSESITKIPHKGKIMQAFRANFLTDLMAHVQGEVLDIRHSQGTDRLGGMNVAVVKNNGSLHLMMPFEVAEWQKPKEEVFNGVTEATPVARQPEGEDFADDLEGAGVD